MKKIVNREISWLSFNERVLQEAEDARNPLIERLRFLGIFSNNLDEFFSVRVASIKRIEALGSKVPEEDKLDIKPSKLLKSISKITIALQVRFGAAYDMLIAEMEKENIFFLNEKQLNKEQGEAVRNYFRKEVKPVLIPLMLNQIEGMPALDNLTIYLAIVLTHKLKTRAEEYALIKVPCDKVSRFFELPSTNNQHNIILLDDVIRYCLDEIFSFLNYKSYTAYTIKLTKDSELDISTDLSTSYLEKIAESVKARDHGGLVRFIHDKTMPTTLLKVLSNRLKLKKSDNLISGGRYHNFKDFMRFPTLEKNHLVNEKLPAISLKGLSINDSILNVIKQKDVLLFYPYHSFNFMIDFVREAAIDPAVQSIKISLYRVAKRSMIINALKLAALNGKEVVVVMEIRARFDELNNIEFANELQEVGAEVIFADPELKVHAKLVLVSRIERNRTVHYANISNGNYNEGTSTVYSDLSLFTKDKRITEDVNRMFKFMKRTIRTYKFSHLLVSPRYLRNQLYAFINKEIRQAKLGKPAYIKFKMNNLVDPEMINKLYEASNAGVTIDLLVRGICCLVPGVKDQSKNITVISILDRFLEHSRFYIFCNSGKEVMYIASADLMTRNLDNRIEVLCPIYNVDIKKQINDIFNLQWTDNVKARIIDKRFRNNYQTTKSKVENRSQIEIYNYLQKQ